MRRGLRTPLTLEMNGDGYRLKQSKSRRRKNPVPASDNASSVEIVDPKAEEVSS